jgi:saccharopine dehydrogenase (NAD+, L-lysine forming)
MKRLLLIGAGAQGSTVAKRMNEETNVSEIICADYDEKAVLELENNLEKAKAMKLDATKVGDIVKAAKDVDLIVNALPIKYGHTVIEAALQAKVHYQDFAAADDGKKNWVEGIKEMLTEKNEQFKAIGKSALISTGSAPGLANVIARESTDKLESCEAIKIFVYEGVQAKRFLPFWWSPEVAYGDMNDEAYIFENGKIVETESFSRPVWIKFKDFDQEIRMVEHAHDEPVTLGLMADQYLKGVKHVWFKYGGVGIDFAEPLYRMGLLSNQPIDVKGTTIIPRDVALKLTPPAPKYKNEIKEILDEGLVSDTGAFLIRVEGVKDGKAIQIDNYVNAPTCAEAFAKSGLTGETYLTGQCGSLFTKMFVNNKITQTGLFPPEVLDAEQRSYYLKEAAKLDITVNEYIDE